MGNVVVVNLRVNLSQGRLLATVRRKVMAMSKPLLYGTN